MKLILIPTFEQCPFRTTDGLCKNPERKYAAINIMCPPVPAMTGFPNFCPLEDVTNLPDCGSCDRSCRKGDSEPILTTDEEIDQLIIAIKALEKRFWTSENRIRCVRAAALLEDIDLDKEVNQE